MQNCAVIAIDLHEGNVRGDAVWLVEEESMCAVYRGFEGDA